MGASARRINNHHTTIISVIETRKDSRHRSAHNRMYGIFWNNGGYNRDTFDTKVFPFHAKTVERLKRCKMFRDFSFERIIHMNHEIALFIAHLFILFLREHVEPEVEEVNLF